MLRQGLFLSHKTQITEDSNLCTQMRFSCDMSNDVKAHEEMELKIALCSSVPRAPDHPTQDPRRRASSLSRGPWRPGQENQAAVYPHATAFMPLTLRAHSV